MDKVQDKMQEEQQRNRIKQLTAITAIDGRYSGATEVFTNIFSEYGLFRNRLIVELNWLRFLMFGNFPKDSEKPITNNEILNKFRDKKDKIEKFFGDIIMNFDPVEALKIKDHEEIIKHDVKSVELYIRDKFKENGLSELSPFIHICLTSEDVNNLAYNMQIKDGIEVTLPIAKKMILKLNEIAQQNAETVMLGLTHGQPALPTTLGKEFGVFVRRLVESYKNLQNAKITGKFNGAVGTAASFNAAFPEHSAIEWIDINADFIKSFGLVPNKITTQIEPHDNFGRVMSEVGSFANIAANFAQDVWTYIQREVIKQVPKEGEVGSSVMPQKVNPIDFENGEANFGLSADFADSLKRRLAISRMQRDLRDSSTSRNLVMPFAYALIGMKAVIRGMGKITANQKVMSEELNSNWAVVAEGIQTILRTVGQDSAYDILKSLTRGKAITEADIKNFAVSLKDKGIPEDIVERILKITPHNYIGAAPELTKRAGELTRDL